MDEEQQKQNKSVVIDSTNIFGLRKAQKTPIEKVEQKIENSVDPSIFASPLIADTPDSAMISTNVPQEVVHQATPISFDNPAVIPDSQPTGSPTSVNISMDFEAPVAPVEQMGAPSMNEPFFELPPDPVSSAASFNFSVDQINSAGVSEVSQPPSFTPSSPVAEQFITAAETHFDPMIIPENAYQDPRALAEVTLVQLNHIRAELQMEISELQSLKAVLTNSFENSERRLNQLITQINTQEMNLINIQQGRIN